MIKTKDTPSVEKARVGGNHRSVPGGGRLKQIAAILEVDPSCFHEMRARPHALPADSEELRAYAATPEARSLVFALVQIDNPLRRRHLLRLIDMIAGEHK